MKATKNRTVAVATFIYLILSLPLWIVRFGVPILWEEYPTHLRWCWLTLRHGKTGPYNGIVW